MMRLFFGVLWTLVLPIATLIVVMVSVELIDALTLSQPSGESISEKFDQFFHLYGTASFLSVMAVGAVGSFRGWFVGTRRRRLPAVSAPTDQFAHAVRDRPLQLSAPDPVSSIVLFCPNCNAELTDLLKHPSCWNCQMLFGPDSARSPTRTQHGPFKNYALPEAPTVKPLAESAPSSQKRKDETGGWRASITSRAQALKHIKSTSTFFLAIAALQMLIGVAVPGNLTLLVVGGSILLYAAALRFYKSRIAAVLLGLQTLGSVVATITSRINNTPDEGPNVILAIVMVWAALRALEATFKLHGRFANQNDSAGS